MKRLNKETINKIKNSVKDGKSLNNISKELKLGKTTAYYHFLKFKGITYKKPIIRFSSDRELGEILGIFIGDGSLCYVQKNGQYIVTVHSSVKNHEYIKYVKKLFDKSFNTKFYWHFDKKRNKINVKKMSKVLFDFFHTEYTSFDRHDKCKTVFIRKFPSREFKIGLIRGLIDTDGTVCQTKCGPKIAFYTSSKKLAKQVRNIFEEFNFSCATTKPRGRDNISVYLHRKSIEDFIKLIDSYKCRRWARSPDR